MFLFKRKPKDRKVFVIGLDCAPPELVFQQWRNELPNLNRLMSSGVWCELRSSIPCITVPAWASMTSSKDPGTLGFYGFRNRADYSYEKMTIATGASVKEPRVWDILGQHGKQVIAVGVPQTYPIKPVNGYLISCFLTPSIQKQYTYPASLADEIRGWLGGGDYMVDTPQFRTDDKDYLLKQIYDMTERRFTVIKHLLTEKPWDFFMFVEMGTDRIHHGFWKYHDPQHAKHEPGNKYLNSIRDYYHYVDKGLGEMLALLPEDTTVIVVSDHGAKRMDGGLCVNEWLRREGLLVLAEEPPAGQVLSIEKVKVDWAKTKVWSSGGYYARIFMNVQGREPQGLIPAADYERFRDELIQRIAAIPGPDGRLLGNVSYKPQAVYKNVTNFAPDLITYFGDLRWRAVGGVGYPDIYTFENDTGPDDANHAEKGIFILNDPREKHGGRQMAERQLMDFAPTILKMFNIPVPTDMQGKDMLA
jgi:predicted AlkP superfamily phosphohydrolase/phosphomutase